MKRRAILSAYDSIGRKYGLDSTAYFIYSYWEMGSFVPKRADNISVYPSEDGYVVRFKRHDGRRLIVKLPVKTEGRALRETMELLTEAIYLLRTGTSEVDRT